MRNYCLSNRSLSRLGHSFRFAKAWKGEPQEMKLWPVVALCCAFTLTARAAEEADLLQKASPHSVATTVERFEAAVRGKGLKVFPRIDHAAAAREFGRSMPPTVVVAFGNPKYGTPFMLTNPQAGIDFPPRAIMLTQS